MYFNLNFQVFVGSTMYTLENELSFFSRTDGPVRRPQSRSSFDARKHAFCASTLPEGKEGPLEFYVHRTSVIKCFR